MKILGIAGSLRNGRWAGGKNILVDEIIKINDKQKLLEFLKVQADLHIENFIESGRKQKKPFSELYKNLKKKRGDSGLSNSEVCLASALWQCKENGSEIDYISLAEHFKNNRLVEKEKELRAALFECDGLVISTPVYFGDRGSLTSRLLDFIKNDEELYECMKGKICSALAVGAKRNGGQETTLIYLMRDLVDMGLLYVGNDSDTTSQYGGTSVGGDVGTVITDNYGLDTCIGVGNRISRVAQLRSSDFKLKSKIRVLFFILQDRDNIALNRVRNLIKQTSDLIEATVINLLEENIHTCIACDICPTHVDIDENYRCIIKSKKDVFSDIHELFLDQDVIVPVVYQGKHGNGLKTAYQSFVERTRYLRRGDYIFSNNIVLPFVIQEIGSSEIFALRIMTSFMRHHTIISEPLIEYILDSKSINDAAVNQSLRDCLHSFEKLIVGRLQSSSESIYNPIGYILSVNKSKEFAEITEREKMISEREKRIFEIFQKRVNYDSTID